MFFFAQCAVRNFTSPMPLHRVVNSLLSESLAINLLHVAASPGQLPAASAWPLFLDVGNCANL